MMGQHRRHPSATPLPQALVPVLPFPWAAPQQAHHYGTGCVERHGRLGASSMRLCSKHVNKSIFKWEAVGEGEPPRAGLICHQQGLARGLEVQVQTFAFPYGFLGEKKPISCKQEELCSRRALGTLQAPPAPAPSCPLCVPRDWTLSLGPAWPHFVSPVTPFSCLLPANMDATSPLPSLGCQDPAMLEGDATLAPARALCPHLNGGLKMLGLPGKAGAKRRPCCQGDADGDIVLLSAVYPRHEECNHGFPLPATELGAAALVTTKTTQNSTGEERA